jgi:hypothetical protein
LLLGVVAVGDGIVAILNQSWILGIMSFVLLAVVTVQVAREARRNRVK